MNWFRWIRYKLEEHTKKISIFLTTFYLNTKYLYGFIKLSGRMLVYLDPTRYNKYKFHMLTLIWTKFEPTAHLLWYAVVKSSPNCATMCYNMAYFIKKFYSKRYLMNSWLYSKCVWENKMLTPILFTLFFNKETNFNILI